MTRVELAQLDKQACETIKTELIKQTVEDWELLVKRMWRGKREIHLDCGGCRQGRKEVAQWLKDYVPQAFRMFPLSGERMREEMYWEYRNAYYALRKAENHYAKVCKYPYNSTEGIRKQIQQIVKDVEAQLVEEEKQRNAPNKGKVKNGKSV